MNKVFVIYDSVFGNTEKIAQTIAVALGTQALPVSQVDVAQLGKLDLLGWLADPQIQPDGEHQQIAQRSAQKSPGWRARCCFRHAHRPGNHRFQSFSIRCGQGRVCRKTIAKSLENKGGRLAAPGEGFYVSGEQGPLKEGELERAAAWASKLLAKCFEEER